MVEIARVFTQQADGLVVRGEQVARVELHYVVEAKQCVLVQALRDQHKRSYTHNQTTTTLSATASLKSVGVKVQLDGQASRAGNLSQTEAVSFARAVAGARARDTHR